MKPRRDLRGSKAARFRAFTLAVGAVALLAAGCTSFGTFGAKEDLPPSPSPEPLAADAPAGFEGYYEQTIDWRPCDESEVVPSMLNAPKDMEKYECATITAPMNWDDPKSEPIDLGIGRYIGAKRGAQSPPLFYNLGGPGGDAVGSLSAVVANVFTQEIVDAYQVVALDPRGVGASSPIWCMTDEERDEDNALDYDLTGMSTEEIIALADEEMAEFGAQCLERNGEILGYVDTDSAARDFDMVRAIVGAETLDYIGFSYGTLLGAVYADIFPDRVGRFVLDGALDPALDVNEVAALQNEGMEASLYNWIESCLAQKTCPLGDTLEEGKQTMIDFFEQVGEHPIETADPDRPLTLGLARTGVVGSLYSTELYSTLTLAVGQALDGDGSTLLFLADYFNDREMDGTYLSNSSDAFIAINSLDYEPVGTVEEWEVEAARLKEATPVLGGDGMFASAGLGAWPVESRSVRKPITATGIPPLLIIGTTNDPATPYEMAVSLHEALPSSVLLTVEGWNHTAYNAAASSCVTSAVDRFLLDGTLPEEGTECR